jgi:hypothetical protein
MPKATPSKILHPYSNRRTCAFVLTDPTVEGKMRTIQTAEMGFFSAVGEYRMTNRKSNKDVKELRMGDISGIIQSGQRIQKRVWEN